MTSDRTSTILRFSALAAMLLSVAVAVCLAVLAATASNTEPSAWAEIGGAEAAGDRALMATALARGWIAMLAGFLVALVLLGVDLARTAGHRQHASQSASVGVAWQSMPQPRRLAS